MEDDQALPSEWEVLKRFLPEGWQAQMHELGVLKRGRKFAGEEGAEALLRTMLIHLAQNLSLRATCTLAREAGIVSISDVALLKRLQNTSAFFTWNTQQLLEQMPGRPTCPEIMAQPDYQWRLLDATVVEEPGATGSKWRLHYGLDARTLAPDDILVTAWRTSERFNHYTLRPNDVLIADSAYSTRSGIAHVRAKQAHLISRFTPGNLPLHTEAGAPFRLLASLRTLAIGEAGDFPVCIHYQDQVIPARVCAVRRSEEAAEQARQRSHRPQTLAFAEYILLITTLPAQIDADAILNIYRYHWQLEPLFKRLKSILRLSPLHRKSCEGMRGWLSGKLFVAALITCIARHAEAISPWGYPLQR